MKKFASIILAAAISVSAVTAMSAGVSAEWVKSSGGYSYKDDETGKKLTGWQTIDGGKYYFDKKGIALTGWKKINGNTYYFNKAKKGKALTSWAKVGGKQYYFGSDGVMRTGWIKLNGKTYYFGDDGRMRTGKVKINGTLYNFGKNGILLNSQKLSSGAKIDDIMEGLDFGMTKKQVIASMPYDDYISDNGMLIVDTGSDDIAGFYVFDSDGLLCSYGFMGMEGDTDITEMEALFENAAWIEIGREDGNTVYCSPDYGSFGIAMSSDDDMFLAAVYSGEIMEAFLGGDTSALDHMK